MWGTGNKTYMQLMLFFQSEKVTIFVSRLYPMIGNLGSGWDGDFAAHCNLPHNTFLKYKKEQKIVTEHVYMRPELNSNRSEISPQLWNSLRFNVSSLEMFTWISVTWLSLRFEFRFSHFDRIKLSNHNEFSI